MNKETYLGDGLYASFNGTVVKLRAPRIECDHEVYMEARELGAFLAFLKNNGIDKEILK
jgi:hypothetical protein